MGVVYGDDGSFETYEVTTVDPGPAMMAFTILISILLYAMLPFMVACGERRDRKRRAWEYQERGEKKDADNDDGDKTDAESEKPTTKNGNRSRTDTKTTSTESGSEPVMGGITHSDAWTPRSRANTPDSCARSHADIWETISIASTASRISWAPKFVYDVIENAHNAGGHGLHRNRLQIRTKELEEQEDDAFPLYGDVNNPDSSSSNGSSTSGGNSQTDSSTDNDESSSHGHKPHNGIVDDSKLKDRPVVPHTGDDTELQKIQSPPPPTTILSTWYAFLEVADWDKENRRVMKLALPYLIQAFLTGIADAATVAIIGKYYGTRSLTAYVVIEMTVGLTTEFFGGITDATGLLATSSIGAGTCRLTGQYFQIGLVLYFLIVTPFTVAWIFAVESLLVFFGFDEETVEIGYEFTKVFVWYMVVSGLDEYVNGFLDISDHEKYSTITTSCRELSVAASLLVLPLISTKQPTLQDGGFCMLSVAAVYLVWNIVFVASQGWWSKYYSGMLHSLAFKNRTAVRSIISTAIPLSFGYLLAYGEWELLTIFAKFLGPAEVAAWGILGTVWDILEESTEAIAEAGEVRCAFYLGAGKPHQAKMSAYKSLLLAFIGSVILTSVVFMCGENLAYWMTDDPTLQVLITDLIPLFGVGNVALAIGSMAWTLVGSQGRYALSTTVGFLGSWCVTVPLSALFSVALNYNLKGQTGAVVIGYMISGTWNTYILLRSDWKAISEKVIAYNTANDIELDSDLESDDSGSNSGDSEQNSGSDEEDSGGSSTSQSSGPAQTATSGSDSC